MASKKKKKKDTIITRASWDWKADDDLIFEALEEALEPFGIYVLPSPQCYGSDSYGFVFSDQEISEDYARDWETEEYEDEDEE